MRPSLQGPTGALGRRRAGLDFPFATINIVLLLLFFFIVTGSIVGKNENLVAPPILKQTAPGRLPRPLLVVGQAGDLFLNDVPVSRDDLVSKAREALKTATVDPAELNLVADRTYSGEAFLALVEAIRAAGIPVRIVTLDTDTKG